MIVVHLNFKTNEKEDKKKKKLFRVSIADLKETVSRPEVVEAHDVTATEPKLLVYLIKNHNIQHAIHS